LQISIACNQMSRMTKHISDAFVIGQTHCLCSIWTMRWHSFTVECFEMTVKIIGIQMCLPSKTLETSSRDWEMSEKVVTKRQDSITGDHIGAFHMSDPDWERLMNNPAPPVADTGNQTRRNKVEGPSLWHGSTCASQQDSHETQHWPSMKLPKADTTLRG